MQKMYEEIFSFFPCGLDVPDEISKNAEEIRIRLGQAILIRYGDNEFLTKQIANEKIIFDSCHAYDAGS